MLRRTTLLCRLTGKSEKKRLAKRDDAIATVDAALAVLPRLRAALTETDINEDVLGRVSSAISMNCYAFTLTLTLTLMDDGRPTTNIFRTN